MLDTLADSRLGIWIVAAAIILADSALLLAPGKFPYRIRKSQSLTAVLAVPSHIFAIRNKNLLLTLLTFPCLLFHISDVSAPLQTTAQLHRTINSLKRLQRHFAFLSLLSLCTLMLVIAGPLLAILHSQALAILIVAGILYPMALAAGVITYLRRHVFKLSRSAACVYAAELVLCPILIVNLGKKLGSKIEPNVNTFQIVALFTNEASKLGSAIEDNLSFFGMSAESPVA